MPRVNFMDGEKWKGNLRRGVWYRSPLWEQDHLLGAKEFEKEGLAWCGRALEVAQGMDNELGGLWLSERKSGKCSECRRKQEEWQAAQ